MGFDVLLVRGTLQEIRELKMRHQGK